MPNYEEEDLKELRKCHFHNEVKARESAYENFREVYKVRELTKKEKRRFFVLGRRGKMDRREYLLDSGASFHLISWKDVRVAERRSYRKADSPETLTTANGPVSVDHVVDIYVLMLDRYVTAFVLDDVPPVLSMGILCADAGLKLSLIHI